MAGKVFDIAFKLGAELTASFNNAFNGAENSMSKLAKTADKLNGMGRALSVGVTAPLVGIGAAVLKIGSDFDSQMSKVAAVSGATGKSFDALRQNAQDLGATTKFTATQVAEGQEYLALAGYDTQQILGATEGVLNLAAAGAMDLGRAADITSDVMSAFGMKAEEAGHAADVFAYAQANANTNVEQAGEAMKYLAPLANQMGWSMEESAAAVMKLADNGLKGSIAGQAFASSIARLAKPTKKMTKTMDELGLSFFDSQGNMKSLPNVVKELETGMKGLTMKQRSAAISTIFGAEAYKHWAILLESGSDTLAQYTKELENSDGTAKRMADTMVDNFAGSLLMLRSALEGVAIQLSDLVKDDLRAFAEYLIKLTGRFAMLSESNKKLVITFGIIAAAVGPVLIGLSILITSFIKVRAAIIATSTAIKGFSLVQMLSAKIMRMYRAATLAYALAGGGFAGVMGVMTAAVGTLNAAILANPFIAVAVAVVALGAAFYFAYKNSEAFRNAVNNAFSKVKDVVLDTVNYIKNVVPGMWDSLILGVQDAGSQLSRAVSVSMIGNQTAILAAVIYMRNQVTGMWRGLVSSVQGVGERIGAAIGDGMTGMIGGVVANYIESMKVGLSSLPGIISMVAPMFTTLGLSFLGVSGPIGWIIGAVVSLVSFLFRLSKTNEDVAAVMSSAWSAIKDAFAPVIAVLSDGINQFASEVGPELTKTIEVISESFSDMAPVFAEVAASFAELGPVLFDALADVFTTIMTVVMALLEVYQVAFPMILTIVGTVIPLIAEIMMSIVPIVLMLVQSVLPLILSVVQMVFPLIVTIISTVVPIVLKTLMSIIPIVLMLVQTVIPLILSVVQMVFPIVLTIIQNVLPVFAALLVTVISVILKLVQTAVPMILTVIQAVLPVVLAIVQAIIPVIAAVLQILVGVINGVVIPAINAILAVVQIVFPYIQMIIENALAIVNGIIQTAMALLQGDWSGAWNVIKATAETIMNNIISFFSGINLFDVGKAIIDGLINGIKSMGGAILGAIKNVVPAPIRGVISDFMEGVGGYAEGGIVTAPELAWVGEGGDTEAIIPWNNSQRSRDLWMQTGQQLGMLGNSDLLQSAHANTDAPKPLNVAPQQFSAARGNNKQVVSQEILFAPVYHIDGGNPQEVQRVVEQSNDDLYSRIKALQKDKGRLEF